MTISDYVLNTYLRRQIDRITDKIIAKKPVTSKDLNNLIRLLSRTALYAARKKDYDAVRAFCGGLASAFKRADELSKIFEKETMVPINNIKKITSDVLGKKEEKTKEIYGDYGDIKVNLRDSLNQLAASIKEEIPKVATAKAA